MYKCKHCDFEGPKSKYDRHNETKKHKNKLKEVKDKYNKNYQERKLKEKEEEELKNGDVDEFHSDNCEKTYTKIEMELIMTKKELELKDAKIDLIIKDCELIKKDSELIKKDSDIKLLEKDVEIEKTKNGFMTEKIVENKTIVKQIATTTKFLLNKYGNNAPPLSRLTTKEATNLLKYDTFQEDKVQKKIKELKVDKDYNEETEVLNIAKMISNKIENKSIKDWMCVKVLKKYKKNDVEKQSLWNTDKARLHFVVKELIKDEMKDDETEEEKEEVKEVKKVVKKVAKKVTKKVTKEEPVEVDDHDYYENHDKSLKGFWKEDPQGAKVTELVIRPILEVVEKMLLAGMVKLTDKIKKNIAKTEEIETLGEISVSHRDFKKIILDQTLEKKMLAKIAAELYLDKKPEIV